MAEQDDAAIVQQTLAGNLRAYEAIVIRYQDAIYSLALRMVHDADDAEDVSQIVFVKAFERLGTYDPNYRFFSWLYRIAMNESLNFLRQRKPHQRLDDVGGAEELQSDAPVPDDVRELEAALQELTDDHRSVIVLKHIEGFSYLEIARMLNISEKKVKSRLFSARQALRDLLVRKEARIR
jgi:RNA polymerase sigma-70 factor, ECF subfamily